MSIIVTTESFIQNCIAVHGNRYDYSEVTYIASKKKINIICKKHGTFKQTPNNHLMKNGCPQCGKEASAHSPRKTQLTTSQFIRKAKLIHGNKYDYSQTTYINHKTPVTIICKKHGVFTPKPGNHIHKQTGCFDCNKENRTKSLQEFIRQANIIHNNKYTYDHTVYINDITKVIITCEKHGDFIVKPRQHLNNKNGCPSCAPNKKLTQHQWIERANTVHNNTYDYSNVVYTNNRSKVSILCKKHGEFKQNANSHLRGTKCPSCISTQYSNKAIKWLTAIEQSDNIYIQHAKNQGEYLIPTTKWKADGYCKKTNTIYEFHGDCFHGNLNRYEPDCQCNPFNNKTAQSLYDATRWREKKIRSLGYNLVVMWESDWDNKNLIIT